MRVDKRTDNGTKIAKFLTIPIPRYERQSAQFWWVFVFSQGHDDDDDEEGGSYENGPRSVQNAAAGF